jgi:hypothetical protein
MTHMSHNYYLYSDLGEYRGMYTGTEYEVVQYCIAHDYTWSPAR